ncbi:MAG: RAD55 family ATPase [Candidatus Hermodarchaeia archaeon]
MAKIKTGLSGFDQITGGGLPRSSAIVVSGDAGTGKEMLTRHLVWNLLQHNAKILYFSEDLILQRRPVSRGVTLLHAELWLECDAIRSQRTVQDRRYFFEEYRS